MRQKMADTIRFLAADMVQKANSGHPGAPMGLADIAVVLSEHLSHNPKDAKWLNRDRLVFSGGHATGLIYSLLHLWGYDVSLDDLKDFRQLDSCTAGHPECGHTDGVEITTGPLGQGIANAVGFAMAAKFAGNKLNSDTAKIIDHNVYCLCGDGDLQEGISYEACATAGHLGLDNLVVIYDSNEITIEGKTDLAWSEDVKLRFEAQGWRVLEIDGHDYEAIDAAFVLAKKSDKPTLIIANTTIAKGAHTMEGSHKSHGAPLGEEEIKAAKEKAGFDAAKSFEIPSDVLERFRCAVEKGELAQKKWNHLLQQTPLIEQTKALEALLNPDYAKIEWPSFEEGDKEATRGSNGKILNAIAKAVPGFLGGSADLAPSNKTELSGMGEFPQGKNIKFGIKEHAMASMVNAMNLYGPLRVFSATFFVFSDYLKPAARIAALANIPHHFIWTHDSIGVGEDGPTHQPIEHLSQFRALPNFYTFRPADANENVECWKQALDMDAPTAFVLSRQGLTVRNYAPIEGSVSTGAYLIKKVDGATHTLIASGSEVDLALEVAKKMNVNVVSAPCFDLLCEQDKKTVEAIIDPNTKVVAIEAATATEWYRFADEVIGMQSFGASGPADEVFAKFGFTAEAIVQKLQ
ncbi:MAG: transketolase [Campylobacterota bacterium]